MCSVAGILTKTSPLSSVHQEEMAFLLSEMKHRGPDAQGQLAVSDHLILGSTRLRVTDAQNKDADMPLQSEDGRFTIVFNGEIYNHKALRAELSSYPFKTASDTETLLVAFMHWGKECLSKLDGMFAFALYDGATDDLWLVSDPTGQKMIYVYEDADILLFASEARALAISPFRPHVYNRDGIAEYIAHRFILGQNTHLEKLEKLEPGTWRCYAHTGRTYSSDRFFTAQLTQQDDRDTKRVERHLYRAVQKSCQESFDLEVPFGLLLSGGIDSTAVLSLAKSHGLQMKTYSIGFQPFGQGNIYETSIFDEFSYSREMAKFYQTDHTELFLTADEYCDILDQWSGICGEPLWAEEAPCLLRLIEQAGRDVRVLFTGSGPDEIFDGYGLGAMLEQQGVSKVNDVPQAYYDAFQWSGTIDIQKLMPERSVAHTVLKKYQSILSLYPTLGQGAVLQAVQLLHLHGRLAMYEFRQMDLISMNSSIEARSPLIGNRIVQSAFDFDPMLKAENGEAKSIYKKALRGIVPEKIVKRPKIGFPIPVEMWTSSAFEERAQILFDPNSEMRSLDLLDMNYLRQKWDDGDAYSRSMIARLYFLENVLQAQKKQRTQNISRGQQALSA